MLVADILREAPLPVVAIGEDAGWSRRRSVGCCRPETSLREIWTTMTSRGLKHVPLLDAEDRPQGIIAARQVLEALLAEVEDEEELLRECVMCLGYG